MPERSPSGSPRPACTTIIAGFHQDADGGWVADLACGHSQLVRHQPPWQNRPWVESATGREAKLGSAIDCPSCEMPHVPHGARERRRTASFRQVLFVQVGGKGVHDSWDNKLVAGLKRALGPDYTIR